MARPRGGSVVPDPTPFNKGELLASIEAWRAHPNYGRYCECTHHAVFHEAGELGCWYPGCSCEVFS